ncbi:hypothetical protein L596_020289 [Steinernema carpocapsae]|uniref:Uncharacterized protein n=1 Tax=Steinernema carpocapsae TaxID=34508 RepID=A0A4V6A0V1_STECR|nr:hypothetical protein L596_020289 [Steinernema carpocapsae]
MFASSAICLALFGAFFQACSGVPIGGGVVPCGLPQCQPCVTCRDPPMGAWTEWTQWSQCAQAYGAFSQTRRRTCSSTQCPGGDGEQARACTPPQEPPQWSQWGAWGQCSVTCGTGVCTRQRTCMSQCSSCPCQGPAIEQKPCQQQPCSCWTQWSAWSQCSITCGLGGFRSRTRQCTCAQLPKS